MIVVSRFITVLLFFITFIECSRRLNPYISHYEQLNYDTQDVHEAHLRAKRSGDIESAVHLSFQAHQQHFRLRLKRDISVFSKDLEIVDRSSAAINIDLSHIYSGHLIDDRSSAIFGSLVNGVFEGKMTSSNGSYYVEKAHNYFPGSKHLNETFHSVIYREDHVEDPYVLHKKGYMGGCGLNDEMIQRMDKIQRFAIKERAPMENEKTYNEQPDSATSFWSTNKDSKNTYFRASNYSKENNKQKRETRRKQRNKTTCSLYIETDPFIWKNIRKGFSEQNDSRKASEVNRRTREEIISLIAQHVTAINYLYSYTKFDGKNEHRNVKFEVLKLKIHDDSDCLLCSLPDCKNQFCLENIDAGTLLDLHSLKNHQDFCLAYIFTYRNFAHGTLGLAWSASASDVPGGVCETYKTYTEIVAGSYQSIKRSLNTGIITLVNYDIRVPPMVSQLMLAHQIGHNFGSPHDYPPECRPGGTNGNYIMFGSATSGDKPNNSRFSVCSIGNISNVLDAIEDNIKHNCFSDSSGSFCGNKVVESGEECDCGFDKDECADVCCYPRVLEFEDTASNSSAKGCHRRANTKCSPSQGPCCSDTCSFIPKGREQICKTETDCSLASKCNGMSAECPTSISKPHKTRCNNGTQLCIQGECVGSICLEWNLTACSLTSQDHPNIDKRKLCQLACKNGTDICRSTSEFSHLVGLPPGGISLRPGSPCNNFQGYCNTLIKCEEMDTDEPLVHLSNRLLLS